MKKINNWSREIAKHNGILFQNKTMFDGADYEFRAIFDSDEDIDAFIHSHLADISKSDSSIVSGQLTFYFSVFNK